MTTETKGMQPLYKIVHRQKDLSFSWQHLHNLCLWAQLVYPKCQHHCRISAFHQCPAISLSPNKNVHKMHVLFTLKCAQFQKFLKVLLTVKYRAVRVTINCLSLATFDIRIRTELYIYNYYMTNWIKKMNWIGKVWKWGEIYHFQCGTKDFNQIFTACNIFVGVLRFLGHTLQRFIWIGHRTKNGIEKINWKSII